MDNDACSEKKVYSSSLYGMYFPHRKNFWNVEKENSFIARFKISELLIVLADGLLDVLYQIYRKNIGNAIIGFVLY